MTSIDRRSLLRAGVAGGVLGVLPAGPVFARPVGAASRAHPRGPSSVSG
ncbi:hypothetical protein ACQP2Y_07715 [Actinoplanes sp. CA-051413]